MTILLVVAVLAAGALAPSAGAHSPPGAEPVRAGTVLNPINYTGPSNCGISPDCRAWLESDCDARLAGVDPAAWASIVDVRDLAGSQRLVKAGGVVAGSWMSGTHYEFWSPDCRRLDSVVVQGWTVVIVPEGAAWMTVPGQMGPYQWAMW